MSSQLHIDAVSLAGFELASSLIATMVARGLITTTDAIAMIDTSIQKHTALAQPGNANSAAATLLSELRASLLSRQ